MKVLPARYNDKPQYVLHPTRLLRRALHRAGAPQTDRLEVAELSWGLPLEVHTTDAIGYSILTGRVFDPCVSEALHRLIDPGELAIDVGANIGYMTSLAATRVGAAGTVLAYEPHPQVFELLSSNVARWTGRPGVGTVEPVNAALSDTSGVGQLSVGPYHQQNMGLSSLQADADGAGPAEELVSVPLARVDEVLTGRQVGVMKIDVEGHEPGVLRGAHDALAGGLIRDIIFEDHDPYPSESTRLVEDAGYQLISLDNDLFGLVLGRAGERQTATQWAGPSYLATRDHARAMQRLTPRGWQIKGLGPSFPWRRADA